MKFQNTIAAVLTAVAAAGTLTAVAAAPASASENCGIKTDVNIDFNWTHWCGTGDHVVTGPGFPIIDYIRDATTPYHRVWLHGYLDLITGTWHTWNYCVYSRSNDVAIKSPNEVSPGVVVHDVLISANTSPC